MYELKNYKEHGGWFECLKSWCHWVRLNPLNEDQKELAQAVNNLFSLLANTEKKLKDAKMQIIVLQEDCDAADRLLKLSKSSSAT